MSSKAKVLICLGSLSSTGVGGFKCPDAWPFPSCPQDGDDPDLTVCCDIDGEFDCCTGSQVFDQ